MAEKFAHLVDTEKMDRDKEFHGSKHKLLLGLMFYAGAVTAALVTVCVLGSVYGQFRVRQFTDNDVKHYDVDGVENAQVDIDLGQNREIFHSNQGTINETLLVMDFNKGVAGAWDAKSDRCFVMNDLGNFPDASKLNQMFVDGSHKESHEKTEFGACSLVPISDYSVVPSELLNHCWGKPVYQLQTKHNQPGHRHRRYLLPDGSIDWCVIFDICPTGELHHLIPI